VVLGAGIALAVPPFELALLVLTCSLVLALEALNSAVEAVCDLVSPTYHPLVKRAKDAAAAAVLLSALGAVMIGGLVLGPRLVAVLR
jgi:diacylglycerol kinase (ATP)